MKREYENPIAEKLTFNYTETVTASQNCYNVVGSQSNPNLTCADLSDSIECPDGVSWRHCCVHNNPNHGCEGTINGC